MVLKRIFGLKREKVTADWRKLHKMKSFMLIIKYYE
jgi:hypothetical protein